MSNDHTTAIVPLQCWAYESPLLRRDRVPIDVGLLAEAMIYYDRILLIPITEVPVAKVLDQPPSPAVAAKPFDREWRQSFLELVRWFCDRNSYQQLVALFGDGVINVYHYAFYTIPLLKGARYMCWNMQDEQEEKKEATFIRRCLPTREFASIVPRARHREKLYRALTGRVIEAHSSDFGEAVNNARVDFANPSAASLALQSLLDEVRPLLPTDLPQDVSVSASETGDGGTSLRFNINFDTITKALAPLEFGVPTPLCGLAHSNRLLWSAATSNCDLYLPSPISRLANAKLVESNARRAKLHQVIDTLEAQVEFPDIRRLVNSGQLSFDEVLEIRDRARRFREWLQTQADRDRDALIAYHHEVTKASGLTRVAGKTLRLFGTLAGAAAGAAIAGPIGAAAGTGLGGAAAAAAQEGLKFVFDLAGKLDEDWRPVVFGDWVRTYAQRTTVI